MSDTSDSGSPAGSSSPAPSSPTAVDPRLLEMLVCPLTKAPLRYDAKAQELISDQARLAYPIRDGIPIMLIDEARPLDPDARR
ncbi:Trm112 family protein [Inquilinus sp. Marseille-Q2685]|uniref:Trm112 family protein n=1 Tax=Inquilinus sp. Marseille-Q2685 TaxID=2866581 RepID=UPI001CE45CA0|nr:Trm112 family protein [Inquilinus sp. Marseille-Q2685]